MVSRLVILILAVTFDLGPATDVPWDPEINLSVELFTDTEAAALKRRVGFDCNDHHVMELNRISLPRLECDLNFNLTFGSSSTNNNHCH